MRRVAVRSSDWLGLRRLPVLKELSDIVPFFTPVRPNNNPILDIGFWNLDPLTLLVICKQIQLVIDVAANRAVFNLLYHNENVFMTILAALLVFLVEPDPNGECMIWW